MSTLKKLLNNVAKLFITLAESDKKVTPFLIPLQCEIRKEVLCEIKQFEPFHFFEQLKHHACDSALPVKSLCDYLIKNDILTSSLELSCFLKFIKAKHHDRLLYSEFLQILLPNKKQKLRQRVLVRQSNNSEHDDMSSNHQKLSLNGSDNTETRQLQKKIQTNIDFALNQVFEQEIRLFRLVEILRQKIFTNQQASTELNLIQAFNSISKNGAISKSDLARFINKHLKNAQLGMDDMNTIFRRLNLEEDVTTISYLEFMNVILPTECPLRGQTKLVQQDDASIYKSMRIQKPNRLSNDNQSKFKSNTHSTQRKTQRQNSEVKQRSSSNGKNMYTTAPTSNKKQQFSTLLKKQQSRGESISYYDNTEPKSASNKKSQRCSLRYSEVRKMQSNISSSLAQHAPINDQQTKYRQVRTKDMKSQQREMYHDQETPRHLTDVNKSFDNSLYTNTIQSPFRSVKSRKSNANTSFIQTPNKTQSQMTIKSNKHELDDDGFDQEGYDAYHKIRRGYVSPMKGTEEDFFVKKLKQWLRLENHLEEVKEELILYCNDFNPIQAFRIFVQNPEKGRNINIYNLREGFELLKVPLTNSESELILKRFDSNRDGHLTYTDICDIFRPRNQALAKEFDQRLPFELQISQRLSEGASTLINKLFATIVTVENHIEHLKQQMVKRPKFKLDSAFKVLNMEGFDRVSQEDLQHLLRIHGMITFPRQVNPLFTRFDKNKDGFVDFTDFKHEISPITPLKQRR